VDERARGLISPLTIPKPHDGFRRSVLHRKPDPALAGILRFHREECPMANAAVRDDQPAAAHRFAKEQLKAIVERVERLEEEKKAIADDIRDVYGEAKVNGYDIKALRTVVRLRKQDANERKEQEAILETYLNALGMLLE
jgi:uncharacterized protein (UPF0335 family)